MWAHLPFVAALSQDMTPANDHCIRGNWSPIDTHKFDGRRTAPKDNG